MTEWRQWWENLVKDEAELEEFSFIDFILALA